MLYIYTLWHKVILGKNNIALSWLSLFLDLKTKMPFAKIFTCTHVLCCIPNETFKLTTDFNEAQVALVCVSDFKLFVFIVHSDKTGQDFHIKYSF